MWATILTISLLPYLSDEDWVVRDRVERVLLAPNYPLTLAGWEHLRSARLPELDDRTRQRILNVWSLRVLVSLAPETMRFWPDCDNMLSKYGYVDEQAKWDKNRRCWIPQVVGDQTLYVHRIKRFNEYDDGHRYGTYTPESPAYPRNRMETRTALLRCLKLSGDVNKVREALIYLQNEEYDRNRRVYHLLGIGFMQGTWTNAEPIECTRVFLPTKREAIR